MDTQPTNAPSPWLAPSLTVTAIVVTLIWGYIQIRHWKEPDADYQAMATSILVTLLLWVMLGFSIWINRRDLLKSKTLPDRLGVVETSLEQANRIAQLRSETIAALEKKVADLNEWSWLMNMAKNELVGNNPSGVIAKIQGIAVRTDELSPHVDILLLIFNSLVWPVRVTDRVSGYVECDGHKLQGPPHVESSIGSGYILQHSSGQEIILRQWLDANALPFVKEQKRRYALNNIELRVQINPNKQMVNHPEGSEIRINMNTLWITG